MEREQNPKRKQSVGRQLLAQHRQLDALFAETRDAFRGENRAEAAGKALTRLRDALETHFAQEDELYYPAIWALRPNEKPQLLGFVDAHEDLRTRVREIEANLGRDSLDEAARAFDALAETFAVHEDDEEQVLRVLDQELAAVR